MGAQGVNPKTEHGPEQTQQGIDQSVIPAEGNTLTIKQGPVDIRARLPKWSVQLIGAAVTLYVAYSLLATPIRTVWVRYQMGVSAEADMKEAQRHFFETPLAQADNNGVGGELQARLYRDGCAAVMWHGAVSNSVPRPHFVRHITAEEGEASPGRVDGLESSPFASTGVRAASLLSTPRFGGLSSFKEGSRTSQTSDPPVKAEVSSESKELIAQGTCQNPHPGNFRWSYGGQNGCWVQVWRQFTDGCTHYQWFNTCGNYWALNPDGSPQIFWTYCKGYPHF